MPDLSSHLQQAQHNLEFLDDNPDPARYADWAVTTCFYAAVHYVDAWLNASGCQPEKHDERHAAMQRCGRDRSCRTRATFSSMWEAYRELEDLSRDARYRCVSIGPDDVSSARRTYLAHVKRWVENELTRRARIGERF